MTNTGMLNKDALKKLNVGQNVYVLWGNFIYPASLKELSPGGFIVSIRLLAGDTYECYYIRYEIYSTAEVAICAAETVIESLQDSIKRLRG